MGRWRVLWVVGVLGCIESHGVQEGEDAALGDGTRGDLAPPSDAALDGSRPGEPPADAGRAVDASADAERAGDAQAPDASPPDPGSLDAGPPDPGSLDASPPDPPPLQEACAAAIAAARAGEPAVACTALPEACMVPMNACCTAHFVCEAGRAVVYLSCDDSCAQGCATYARENCALDPACAWFETHACGPGPEGSIDTSSCAPRRLGPCAGDGTCPEGQRCQAFLVEACVEADCDACATVARACVW